jgi:hypothetical protein
MPYYAPLPEVLLDPRNEAELVKAAARRVYESSNATLNDFSSGSPIMALLEGQAFAQSEFLQFANQFPESVLVEWIGPFLGAQRRVGSGAIAYITFNITPRNDQFDIFEGFLLSTDPALTGGESLTFVTTERLIIPAGQSQGKVRAISLFRGEGANVPANTITRADTSLNGVVSVNNEEAAAGGQDPELLSEVKERFFSLIRRRNPVSAEDWEDWFSDAIGPGTAVTVLPRRSERDTYLYGGPYQDYTAPPGAPFATPYGGDYIQTNPSVAFFVLNPDGTPITRAQQASLTNLLQWSLPIEFLGYIYPMEVNDADFVIELQYDPAKPYAQDLISFTKTVRDNLFSVMTPNAVFPVEYEQQVNDVESALTTSFPITLGTTNQYVDPDVKKITVYSSPVQIGVSEFRGVTPKPFEVTTAVQEGDLVLVQSSAASIFYPALESFNPTVNTRQYYVNNGDLDLELIQPLVSGSYRTGDVVTTGGEGALYVVLADFTFVPDLFTLEELIEGGYLSDEKAYTDWEAKTFNPFENSLNRYDPQIFAYVLGDAKTAIGYPANPVDIAPNRRPGAPVYVVNREFTVEPDTSSLGTTQAEELVSTTPVTVEILAAGQLYGQDEYVKTPSTNELLPARFTKENCYIDPVDGVRSIYAKVLQGFTFSIPPNFSYSQAFDALVEAGLLKIIQVIPFVDCQGTPTYTEKPFLYEARFFMGEYLRYRPSGGFDADLLEECVRQNEACQNVSDPCRKLLEANLPLPRYFMALKDFTPYTQNIDQMISDEVIVEVQKDLFVSSYSTQIKQADVIDSNSITSSLIDQGDISSTSDLIVGSTVKVTNERGDSRGVYSWSGMLWTYLQVNVPTFREMFRFAPGDVASFRSVSEIRNYQATDHVTPLLDLEVYYDNGLFVRTRSDQTVSWYDANYHLEDIVFDKTNNSTSFYRVTRSFTPPEEREIWNSSTATNSPRLEEIYRNLIKFVNKSECSDAIQSRLRDRASSVKLGTCQLNLVSKSQGSTTSSYVFESTPTANISAPLSVFPSSSFKYGPVNYGDGTLAL